MSNATLEMMQEIEQAAQGVIVGYEAQVEQIRTDSRDRLATVAHHYDEETKQLRATVSSRSFVKRTSLSWAFFSASVTNCLVSSS